MPDTPSTPEHSDQKHTRDVEPLAKTAATPDTKTDEGDIFSILSSRVSLFKPHYIPLEFDVESIMSDSKLVRSAPGTPSVFMANHEKKFDEPLPSLPRPYFARDTGLTYSYFGGRSEVTLQDDKDIIEPAHRRFDSEITLTPSRPNHERSDSEDSFNPLKMHKRDTTFESIHSDAPLAIPPAIKMSTFQEVLFIGVVAISHFVTQAGLGLNLAPLDIISETFRITNPGQQAWMIAGYSLTVGTFILIAGRMGDVWGHKRMLAFGYAWFGVWSGFAGFAAYTRLQILFDVCRALQGIGPALIMPNGLALFGRAYPPGMKKNIVFSIFGAVAPAGFVVGATFGSLFAQFIWWPWAFWSFGIALWFLSAMSLLVVPRELSGLPNNPPGFDWTGSGLGVAGLVLVNVAWNNGPLYGWGTPHVYFLLIIGLLCLAAFFWVEHRVEHPIVQIKVLNGTVGFILACIGLGWGAFGVWVFYSFRFLAQIRDITSLTASAQFAPAAICGFLAAGATAFMLTHTPVSFVMMVSMGAFAAGILVTVTMPPIQSYWSQMFISVIIMPFGMDMSFPAASVILSNHMGMEHQGLAMSLLNTVVNYSISIALGIAGTVEVNIADHSVASRDEVLKGYRGGLYTAVALSCTGVCFGLVFFLTRLRREGWKVMDH